MRLKREITGNNEEFTEDFMGFYIGIEDLAANALIEILSESDRRFVTYRELEEYGAEVVNILLEQNEKAVLILSRDNTYDMLRSYSGIFTEEKQGDDLGISLRGGVGVKDLIDKFRGYLALDVLLAFVDKRSIAKLGIAA